MKTPRAPSAAVLKRIQALPHSPVREVLIDAFANGWSMPLLAHSAGLTPQTLYKIIQTPHGDCRGSTVRRLQDALAAGLPRPQESEPPKT